MKLTRQQKDDIHILIRHALEDMDYGGGGSYVLDVGSDRQREDARSIKRAKRAIALISLTLLEPLTPYEKRNTRTPTRNA